MNILIVGSGGREHAFAYKIKQSPLCTKLFIAPGNAGTETLGTNLSIAINDFESLALSCIENNITLILVGPEEPLVNGIYDYFKTNENTKHIAVIGPSKNASQLEGSKSFAKAFMKKHNVPTAAYAEFTKDNYETGVTYIKQHTLPIVLKADGLAAGKGVLICQSHTDALYEFELMLQQSKFGKASTKVVIEEFLNGIELSIFILVDGCNYLLLPEAKDYKRIGEGDTGLNTGGMGAVSPVPFANETFLQKVINNIIEPTVAGLQKDNLEYKGFVFIGLMNYNGNPMVIEYNCRMGDPETEVVIPRIKNDFVELLIATANQTLNTKKITIDSRAAAAVVAVSGGYPSAYSNEKIITGLNTKLQNDNYIFQSGTIKNGENIITNGGRVVVATSFAESIASAVLQSNKTLNQIHFDGKYYRTDIGYEFD